MATTTGCQRCGTSPDLVEELRLWRESCAPDLDTIEHQATPCHAGPLQGHGHQGVPSTDQQPFQGPQAA